MAFQRPFLISLRRSNSQEPWGFRLIGGTNIQPQHFVQQVNEGGLSEHCGLREGDEIIQIGRINVQSLSHQDVQEIIVRCKDRVELFIIREDLLRSRKENEPPIVKAVVHSNYNSPFQLYSSENVADTLALQTTALTNKADPTAFSNLGPQSPPIVLHSDVLQVVKEQEGKKHSGYLNGEAYPSPPPRKKQAPPTAPKPSVRFQNPLIGNPTQTIKTEQSPENHSSTQIHQERTYQKTTKRTVTQQQSYNTQESYQQQPQQEQFKSQVTFQPAPPPTQQTTNQQQAYNQQQELYEQQRLQQLRTQQQQQQQYQQQQQHQQQSQEQIQLQQQRLREQQLYQQQLLAQQQQAEQQQRQREQQILLQQQQRLKDQQARQEQFENQQRARGPEHPGATPNVRTKPSFDKFVGANNQHYTSTSRMTPSPMGSPVVNRRGEVPVWPPKRSSVNDVPKTGFSPGYIQDKCSKKFTWPPPKEFESNFADNPVPTSNGVANAWHPADSPAPKSLPFARSPTPTRRSKDIQWPPPHSLPKEPQRHSPRVIRRATGQFEDYVHQHASVSLPPTYRTPPGTQHVEVVYED